MSSPIAVRAIGCWSSRRRPNRRAWAAEGAAGLGSLLAHQLVAAGETVLDVPPKRSGRARPLDSGRTDKTDPYDARSAAVVAWRHESLQLVRPVDHTAGLRLPADRRHDLVALRTRTVCRLHALLCLLTPGGFDQRMSADQAARVLRGTRPTEAVATERKHMALELLADLPRLHQ